MITLTALGSLTLLEIITLGYLVNFVITVYMVIYYLIVLANENSILDLNDNQGKKSRVPAGILFPYGSILERILVHMEYRKFKAQGGGTLAEFINYMFIPKD